MKRLAWSAVGLVACNATFRFDEPPASVDAGDGGVVAPDASFVCTSDPACGGLRCDLPTGRCVACLGDSDCASPRARCEPIDKVCVACLNGPDCGRRQTCDTVTNRCLDACFDPDDCLSPGFVCDADRGLCLECKTAANCVGSPGGRLCNSTIGRCVQCSGDADCTAPNGLCDRRTGTCVVCVGSDDCPAGQVCDPVGLVCRAPTGS